MHRTRAECKGGDILSPERQMKCSTPSDPVDKSTETANLFLFDITYEYGNKDKTKRIV